MKAVLLYQYGGPEQLLYEETDTPAPGDGEVLVRIKATSINPIDLKMRSGAAKEHFPVHFPGILGRDLVGEVVESGGAVAGFPTGMRVMGLAWATYAEFAVAKAEILAPIPDALTFEQAAALPLVTLTGAQLIERAVKPPPDPSTSRDWTVLVTGAMGSVGRSAVHVARKHGVRVLAGVRGSQKEKAAQLSADGIVVLEDDRAVAALTDLDAIADTVDGSTIQRLLHAIRKGGVLGSVLGKPEGAEKYDIRVEAFTAQPDAPRLRQLADDVARKEFSIPIGRTMKLSEIQEAHRLAEKGGVEGKIILVP